MQNQLVQASDERDQARHEVQSLLSTVAEADGEMAAVRAAVTAIMEEQRGYPIGKRSPMR